MKNQALFSSENKSKKLKCRLLQFLFGALRIKVVLSQGIVVGPLLFSLYITGITENIDSALRLFADGCVCYREIKDIEDTVKLHEDIDRLGCWARSWGMRFQPVKCNIMQITRNVSKRSMLPIG